VFLNLFNAFSTTNSVDHPFTVDVIARMDAQRDLKTKAKAISNDEKKKTTDTSLNSDDATMLELTLGMLRCSVCKDRFKEVTLVRCFHLFCRECIDENLRNRHRKCPACGEKFGQDDVKNIFFTN
jgi:E3 ubiquitin-protein ligase BRE1